MKNIKSLLLIVFLYVIHNANAQNIGIGTSSPNSSAKLDISATNRGLLIPRVALVNVTNNTTPVASPATGLLVFNTNAAVTGGSGTGFYHWNGTEWEKLAFISDITQDHDWYEVGTTTAPDDITDDMFHTGKVGIGTDNPSVPLQVDNATNDTTAKFVNTKTAGPTKGIYVGVTNTSAYGYAVETKVNSPTASGVINWVEGTGTGSQYGVSNYVTNTANGTHFGVSNILNGNGSGAHTGVSNYLQGSGTGDQFGSRNWIANTGNGAHYGTYDSLYGSGTGQHIGKYSVLTSNGDGVQYGNYSNITNSGNAKHFGTYDSLSGTGSGIHYGKYTSLSGTGTGRQYGNYNIITNSGDANHYGTTDILSGSGTGIHIGKYTSLTGTSTGAQYANYNIITNNQSGNHAGIVNFLRDTADGSQLGAWNIIDNSGDGEHFGTENDLSGSGAGIHYGTANYISGAGTNWQLGTYNEITNSGNGDHFGVKNWMIGSGSGPHSAVYNDVIGIGTGEQYGVKTSILNSGSGKHYGTFNSLGGTGTGNKYATYDSIVTTAGGKGFGVFSSALDTANDYAGFFRGKVSIGMNYTNNYIMPTTRGTNNQIIVTDGAGNTRWANARSAIDTVAWLTTGNTGTTAATNFIGTTDANDFIVKTAGGTATNERLRVIGAGATPGQIIINNTGLFAGDVFSSYANNTTNGTTASINNTIGTFAVNGYSAGNGTGVYGEVNQGVSGAGSAVWGNLYGTSTTASTSSEAVWGTNGTSPLGTGVTAAVATGVRGESSGAAGTAFTMGVLGTNTATAGAAYGVYGQTSSPNAMGVFGVNLDVSAAPAHGIQGQTAANGSAAGLRGFNTAAAIGAGQNGFGVRGSVNVVPTGTGFVMGVRGDCNGATGSTYGVYGQSASATGFGMDAANTNSSGTGLLVTGNNAAASFLAAGSGAAINGSVVGTYSIAKTVASGVGVFAVGNNLTGSITTPANGCGVAGTGTQYGVMGFATTMVNTTGGSTYTTNGASASAGGYFEVQNAGTAQTWAYVGVRDNGSVLRKIIGPGTVNTIVKDLKGNRVALSCPEAPENLFQDYGNGKLINGKVHVDIDPIFSKNIVVNEKHALRVFVQLEGDCEGVFVSNKSQNGFDVTELKNGKSNVEFTYTIIANRADEVLPDGSISKYSEERFAPAPGPIAKTIIETKEANELVKTVADDKPVNIPSIKPKPNPKLKNEKNY